jgi:hypothetical protein
VLSTLSLYKDGTINDTAPKEPCLAPLVKEVVTVDEHQVMTKPMKACPRCFEQVHADAEVCRYCLSRITTGKDGKNIRVRIKAGDKVYRGDLFVGKTERISDTVNDARRFIILTNAKEEGKLSDISIGFLALNKDSIESVRLAETDDGKSSGDLDVRQIY